MSDSGAGYPDVGGAEYELRLTRRALADLGCPRSTAPADFESVRSTTKYPAIVDEFISQRTISPRTTGGTLHGLGYPNIDELHSTDGGRGCTWYDESNGICWLLAFAPGHNYAHIEARAASGELLPDVDDETVLEVEREELDFAQRIVPGLRDLVDAAIAHSAVPQYGRVGGLLRLEVTIVAEPIDDVELADVFISIALPPYGDSDIMPEAWPGHMLQQRIVELVFGDLSETPTWEVPQSFPTTAGERATDFSRELPVVVRSIDVAELQSDAVAKQRARYPRRYWPDPDS